MIRQFDKVIFTRIAQVSAVRRGPEPSAGTTERTFPEEVKFGRTQLAASLLARPHSGDRPSVAQFQLLRAFRRSDEAMALVRVFLCVLSVIAALVSDRFLALAAFSQSLDSDFTFTLPAGRKECFYQTMKKDASLEIEYQVLDGAGLDVDFYISSPSGQVLFSDYRKSDGVHTVETEDGDYMFCFDNAFSAVSEKLIFFELILDNMDQDEEPDNWKEYVHGTDMLDMKLEDIMDTINSVKARLGKSVQIQTLLRAFEARDRNIQESNFDRVNFWSMLNLVAMVLVSALQVYLLRSLFDDKRKVHT